MKKKQLIGDVLLELEVVLDKMYDMGFQEGDVLWQVFGHTRSHRLDAVQVYEEDDSLPIMKYGHKDQI